MDLCYHRKMISTKRHFLLFFFLIALFGSSTMLTVHAANQKPSIDLTPQEQEFLETHPIVHLAIDISWPPFEYIDENGIYRGLASEYMQIISERLGVPLVPEKEKAWADVVEMVKKRELDAYSCAVATDSRQKYMNFTLPYLSFPMVIITSDQVSFINGLDALKDKKIAVAKSYATHDILSQKHPELDLLVADSIQKGLKSVSHGQAFAFIGNIASVGHVIKEEGITNVKISGELPYRFELAIGVRNDWPELVPIFQKALDSISEKEREVIHQKYITLKFEKGYDYTLIWEILGGFVLIAAVLIYWNRTLFREIKRRKIAEEKLSESRKRLELSLQGANLGTWDWNLKTGQVLVDQRWASMLGYRLPDIKLNSDTISDYVHPDDMSDVTDQIQKHLSGQVSFYEADIRFKTASGGYKWIRAGGQVVEWDEKSQPSRMVGVHLDTDEKKRTEVELLEAKSELESRNRELRDINRDLAVRVSEEIEKYKQQETMLIQQSKMAAMGEMIGAIAHQWKQPLNNIAIQIQEVDDLVQEEKLDHQSLAHIRRTVLDQVQFMSETINDFRNFFVPSKQKHVFNVAMNCQNVLNILKAEFQVMSIQVNMDDAAGFYTNGYANEFKQVILNLLNNARDSLKQNRPQKPCISILFETSDNLGKIRILDNGGGIPEELLPNKLFEAYVSTKGDQGTGIGLQISKTIIETNMDGRLYAQNTAEGAEFIIELPLSPAPKK